MASARMYVETKMPVDGNDFFSDEDINKIEREVHEHVYREHFIDVKVGMRIFRCIECGFIREVKPGSKSNPYQNMLPNRGDEDARD